MMAIKILFCYAREDEMLLEKLQIHLKPLQKQGIIDIWDNRMISAGINWRHDIDEHLNTAQIILVLISPDFIASAYLFSAEMNKALERQRHGEARLIPIILRPTHWEYFQGLYDLQVLPTNAIPLTSSSWSSLDDALFDVVTGIQKVISELLEDTTLVSDATNNVSSQ